MVHTNGTESFWATLTRGYHGVYHQVSHEYLDHYVSEFQSRHNRRSDDTEDQMASLVKGMEGRHLRYQRLIANGVRASRMLEAA